MLQTCKYFIKDCHPERSEGPMYLNSLCMRSFASLRMTVWIYGAHLQARFNPGSRVEEIAQCISNKVERENREHHRHCREEHEMRSVEEMRSGIVQHRSPT